ncbi:MAG TPA: O-antigen ligase family protein [Sumerlaeia bacterium]|nr:O-antigen ligase family protein [Sumerlaeia bacterium]
MDALADQSHAVSPACSSTSPVMQLPPPTSSAAVRAARVFALLALAASACAYPLRIRKDWLIAFFQRFGLDSEEQLGALWLEGLLNWGFSPLVLKEVLASWMIFGAVASWFTWRLSRPFRAERPRAEVTLLLAFLGWCVVSVFWAPHFGYDSACLTTAVDLCVWAVFALALYDLPYTELFARRAVRWIVGIGLVLGLISVSQATVPLSKAVFSVMSRYEGLYKRNLYGSLIGHNSGLAAACMGPFFFVLGGFFLARRKRVRLLLGLSVVFFLYLFVVTQTRSAWVQLTVLTPLFLAGLKGAAGVGIRARYVAAGLAVLAAVIASVFLPDALHFLPGSRREYIDRLRAMTPAVLLKGTRLRVLAVSGSLIAEKPFRGHGLGSFQVVYPDAQADYFARHPDSVLVPVPMQTQQAHNDYVQLLIETGAVGCGLAFAMALLFFRRGFRQFRETRDPQDRLRRYCAFFGIASLLLHACVDFPFHLAPLATLFIFYCAIALGDGARHRALTEEWAEARTEVPGGAANRRRVRAGNVGRLALILSAWGLAAVGVCLTYQRLMADLRFCRGTGILLYADQEESPDLRLRALTAARRELRGSLRIDPLQHLPRMTQGLCEYRLAQVYAERVREAAEENASPAVLGETRAKATTLLESAIGQLHLATHMARSPQADAWSSQLDPSTLGSRLNHATLYYLALCWRLMAALEPDRPEGDHNTWRSLQLTVRYCPSHADALPEILRFMDRKRVGTAAQQRRYMRLFAKYHPRSFLEFFFKRVESLKQQERHEDAVRMCLLMLESLAGAEGAAEVLHRLALQRLEAGDTPGCRQIVARLRDEWPNYGELPLLEVVSQVVSRDYAGAEKDLARLLEKGVPNEEGWRLLYAEILIATGRQEEGEALSRQIIENSEIPALAYTQRGEVKRVFFGDLQGALKDYAAALHVETPFTSPNAYFHLMRDQARRGDWAAFEETVALARTTLPQEGVLERLEAALRAQYAPKTDKENPDNRADE